MYADKTQAAYAPDAARFLRPGERAELARFDRAATSLARAKERALARPYITTRDRLGALRSDQQITPYAIDGIHPTTPFHRIFSPGEAHYSRGLSADRERRRVLFQCAMVSAAQFPGTAWQAYYLAARAAA